MYTFQSIIKVSLYWWHYSSVFYISLHLSLSAQFKFTVCSNSVTTIPQGGNAVLCMGWFMNRKLQLGNKNKQVFLHLFQQLQKSCTIRSNVKMLKLTWFSWKHSSVSSICGVCVLCSSGSDGIRNSQCGGVIIGLIFSLLAALALRFLHA